MNEKQKIYLKTFILLSVSFNIVILALLFMTFTVVAGLSDFVYASPQEKVIEIPVVEQHVISVEKQETPEEVEIVEEVKVEDQVIEEPISQEEQIKIFIKEVCSMYDNVEPELVMSVVYHESRFKPEAVNGNCVGLMQVSTYWHSDRATRLGVTDFYDPYSNILLGVDYISELTESYGDTALVLMLYNMKHDTAFDMFGRGEISSYAKSVLEKAKEYKGGV